MNANFLKVMIVGAAVVLFAGIFAPVCEAAKVSQVSGEIVGIDLTLGTIQLKSDAPQSRGEIMEYRIGRNEKHIMNSSDKKLRSIKELQPGQYVTMDIKKSKKGQVVKRIVVAPSSAQERADEKAQFKRTKDVFKGKENKEFRAKMKAEEKTEKKAEATQLMEDSQNKGEGQVKVEF